MPIPFEVFKDRLLAAAGETMARRGYALQDDPIQMHSGLYRFAKPAGGETSLIDVQLLFYSGGGPSRLEVKCWRADQPKHKVRLGVWLQEHGAPTLADERGWWEFVSGRELDAALQDVASGLEKIMNAE